MIITTIKTIEEKREVDFPYFSKSKDTGAMFACMSENCTTKLNDFSIVHFDIAIVGEIAISQKEFFDKFDETMNFILLKLNK